MAACNFSIPFTGNAQDVYTKARAAVEKQGGSFSGDAAGGSFSLSVFGTISGSYTVAGQSLEVAIESKPMLISCGMIEDTLKKAIGG